jgi:hypothetical protein
VWLSLQGWLENRETWLSLQGWLENRDALYFVATARELVRAIDLQIIPLFARTFLTNVYEVSLKNIYIKIVLAS